MPPTRTRSCAALDEPSTLKPRKLKRGSCRVDKIEWNTYKEDIRRAYVDQNHTLTQTMQMVPVAASERKWKQKLKDWGFQKNHAAKDIAILISKRAKRLRDDGKETVFFQDGIQIRMGKLENFKRRKTQQTALPISPNARTYLSEFNYILGLNN